MNRIPHLSRKMSRQLVKPKEQHIFNHCMTYSTIQVIWMYTHKEMDRNKVRPKRARCVNATAERKGRKTVDVISCLIQCQETCLGRESLPTLQSYAPKPTLLPQDLTWHSSSRQHDIHHKYHSIRTQEPHTQSSKSSKLNLVIRKCGYLSKLRWGDLRLGSLLTSSRSPPGGTGRSSLARCKVPAASLSRKVAVRVSLAAGSPTASHPR